VRLQIDKGWAVDWDGLNHTLIHLTVITGEGKGALKTKAENIGKLRETISGYFGSNLRHALMHYVTKSALEGEGTVDVSGLLAKLDQIEDVIKKLGKPAFTDEVKPAEAPAEPEPTKPVLTALDL
jgi:hypothetical protein